jgi:hypothetical protein
VIEREQLIKTAIAELRQKLLRIVDEKGLNSPEALSMSEKLDRVLNVFYQTRFGDYLSIKRE